MSKLLQLSIGLASAGIFTYALASDAFVPNYVDTSVQINKTFSAKKVDGQYQTSNLNKQQKEAFNDALDLVHHQILPTKKMVTDVNKIKQHSINIVNNVIHRMQPEVKNNGKLYYFISFSMPDKLIKGYIKEAIWSGGTLVLRGIDPEYKTLSAFLNDKVIPLVDYKGAHPPIEIDPNKYDEYNITTVPIIVYSTVSKTTQCTGTKLANGYEKCNAFDSDKYWKMAGTVSTYYALNAFKKDGAPVGKNIEHLENMSGGYNTDKKATTYSGKLQDLPQPLSDYVVKGLLGSVGLSQNSHGQIGKKSILQMLSKEK